MPDTPLARLKEFAHSWNSGDTIDEESGLTRDDLDAIIAEIERPDSSDEIADRLGDLA